MKMSTTVAEMASAESASLWAFEGHLRCDDCALLEDRVGQVMIVKECNMCCSSSMTLMPIYPRSLRLFLRSVNESWGGTRKSRTLSMTAFPGRRHRHKQGQKPRIILVDADENEIETVNIGGWKTDQSKISFARSSRIKKDFEGAPRFFAESRFARSGESKHCA